VVRGVKQKTFFVVSFLYFIYHKSSTYILKDSASFFTVFTKMISFFSLHSFYRIISCFVYVIAQKRSVTRLVLSVCSTRIFIL